MAEHTPGPWEIKAESEHRGGRVRKLQVLAPHGLHGSQELFCRFGPDDTDKANAGLIAAAPELLSACANALDTLYLMGDDESHLAYRQEAIKELQAAIAKAKGG